MSLDPSTFTIHDIREFPFIVFNQAAAQPGYAKQWEAEMVALLGNGQPFVVVYDQLRTDETHEDRKHRGIWLKHNKEPLGRVCKALISIEPDEERRAQVKAMSEIAVKAFGIPHEVAATREDALRIARRLTGDDT
ncbi:hypothetical protein FZ025_19930 [Xanthomonas hyacinthi]|uniref:Uncharacterized protein n=1 Tax=Xanthomonas hyacinthi TaxID=56455 RepID=A0A2S7EQM5_9XANT|nr:hypothetical protein [Xanthomonas hyacinthi]KLD72769.1 hypothetical protein Y886_41480 [Xanthomonas hyacinthi DSM 19077]PPU95425.1 hypothetical protein XhyaCFBP1156_18860 [Xanthomonas hyacinthi]QGY78791.1 hypothetical protein FZ025_19930 [Xanthomonas hyacinthi]